MTDFVNIIYDRLYVRFYDRSWPHKVRVIRAASLDGYMYIHMWIYISQCAARRSRHRATHKVCHRIFLFEARGALFGGCRSHFGHFWGSGGEHFGHFGVLEAALGPQSLAESAKQFQAPKSHERVLDFGVFLDPFSNQFWTKSHKVEARRPAGKAYVSQLDSGALGHPKIAQKHGRVMQKRGFSNEGRCAFRAPNLEAFPDGFAH